MTDIATYVVSDIHGEYELFIRLLEEIHLKETDTLYVLGDILDRGPHPIQIILKLMEMPNVVCLTGNHELMALECLEFLMQEITEISIEKVDEKMLENLVTWQYNGSKSTIDEFRTLSREMQYEVIDFIKDFMIYEELTVNGKNYLLVHGGLGNYYPGKDMEEYSLKELIWDRAEYDIQYFEDTYVVTGHTPTQGIMGNLDYSQWYFGHYHDNIQYIDAQLLYEEIKELGEPDSVQKVGRPRYRVGEMVYFTFGKEDAREGYGTVEWVDDHGTLGQEKEVSYDIVGIPCELPGEKTLFKHIRESKIQSIDEMEIVRIEREEG